MAKRIVVDPITRIEGHLRIEAEARDGKIVDAYSSGTMVRGFEIILKGRDPRDAWAFAERACGVCTTVHALASVRTVEDALQITVPPNAELIRNLMFCAQYMQDHVVHFYHLHALDWVDVVSALKADPKKTSDIAQSISSWPKSSPKYFADVQKRLTAFVNSGQLGIFANAYWGHPAFKLPAEVNLLGTAHYLEALEWQKEMVKVHTIFGGKNPHPNYLVGGVPCAINIDDSNALNTERLSYVKSIFDEGKTFIEQVYIPDLLAVASFYKDWGAVGGGLSNYLVYGDLPTNGIRDPGKFKFPRGVILDRDLSKIHEVDGKNPQQIQEFVAHSWYAYSGGDAAGKHPWDGETKFNFTGPKPPYDQLQVEGKYSWLKTPRWNGKPMEVGPLARLLVAYAGGREDVKEVVDGYAALSPHVKVEIVDPDVNPERVKLIVDKYGAKVQVNEQGQAGIEAGVFVVAGDNVKFVASNELEAAGGADAFEDGAGENGEAAGGLSEARLALSTISFTSGSWFMKRGCWPRSASSTLRASLSHSTFGRGLRSPNEHITFCLGPLGVRMDSTSR